jgi:hypothetical protein
LPLIFAPRHGNAFISHARHEERKTDWARHGGPRRFTWAAATIILGSHSWGAGRMRKPKFATSCLCALQGMAGAVSPVKSEDRPRPALNNVSLVVYTLAPANKGRCAIDWEAWNTAINFVANQSTKLKLIREREHEERRKELLDKAKEAGEKFFATRSDAEMAAAKKAWDEAIEKHLKYFAAPAW